MKLSYVGNCIFSDFPCCSIEDVVAYCRDKKAIGLDIETSRKFKRGTYSEKIYKPGLDPYLSRVVMVQIGDENHRFVIDARVTDIRKLKPILEDGSIQKVGHNMKFEYKHILHNYGIRIKNVWDTMLVELILFNGEKQGYSLEDVAKRRLGIKSISDVNLFSLDQYNADQDIGEFEFDRWATNYVDKSTRLGFINIGDKPFTTKQIKYGEDDIIYPLEIRKLQLQGRDGWYPDQCIKLENEFCLVLGDIELKGMHFDPEKWMNIYEQESFPNFLKHKEWLDNYVIKNIPEFTSTINLFSDSPECAVQWTSSKQVIKLFRFLGFCPKERSRQTGKKEWSVGDKALQKVLNNEDYSEYHGLINKYLKFKKFEQLSTTFGKDFFKYIHPITKRIHSSYRQLLNTGRISSTSPNLQNQPAKTHRTPYTATKGYKILNSDYDGQETVYLANVSGDQVMVDTLNAGVDMHCFVATRVYRVKLGDPDLEITKASAGKLGEDHPDYKPAHAEMRQDAKTIGFGIPYGKSEYALQYDLNVSIEDAKDFIDLYYRTFPTLRPYFEECHKKAIKQGWIEIDPITKRRYFFDQYQEMWDARNYIYDNIYPDNYETLDKAQQESIKEKHREEARPYWKKFFALKGSLERRAQNYPIQGGCGSITKLAAILIRRRVIELGWEDIYFMTNLVHDEINSEALEEIAEKAAEIQQECMEQAGAYWCKLVPLKAEVAIENYWTH